ncbi:MAG: Crp/Fnr family transcriptional regulator [Prolixibacteraceae bacterium]
MEQFQKIKNCALFKGMSLTDISELFNQINCSFQNYQKDEYLIRNGSYQKSLIILIHGTIKGEVMCKNGNFLCISEQHDTSTLSMALVFGVDIVYPMDLIAVTDVEVLKIEKEDVLKMMKINHEFLRNYLGQIAEGASYLYQRIICISQRSLKERFIVYLLAKAKEQNSDLLVMQKTQTELAQFFGVNRPSLTREIRALHNSGLIDASGKVIRLLKMPELVNSLSCESEKCFRCLCFNANNL